jgi:hypothetical protein
MLGPTSALSIASSFASQLPAAAALFSFTRVFRDPRALTEKLHRLLKPDLDVVDLVVPELAKDFGCM